MEKLDSARSADTLADRRPDELAATETTSRREWLTRNASRVVGLAVLTPVAMDLAACAQKPKAVVPVRAGVVNLGPARQFPAGTVNTDFESRYGIVVSNDGGTITAINPVCTHRGCLTKWLNARNEFYCHCHGSRFDLEGVVLHGPATQPLHRVATIRNEDGTVSVDLTKLYAMPFHFAKPPHEDG